MVEGENVGYTMEFVGYNYCILSIVVVVYSCAVCAVTIMHPMHLKVALFVISTTLMCISTTINMDSAQYIGVIAFFSVSPC